MEDVKSCYLCDRLLVDKWEDNHNVRCKCSNCGTFWLSFDAQQFLPPQIVADGLKDKRYLLSGYVRELQERGAEPPWINLDNYQELLAFAHPPKTLGDKIERVLLYVYQKTNELYDEVPIDVNQPAVVYARSKTQFESWLQACIEKDVLERPYKGDTFRVTLHGVEIAERLEHEGPGNQCFVAMWFSEDMRSAYRNAIKPAIEDGTGYEAITVDTREFNGDIVDQIIAEIRRSHFIVVDLTGHRGGAYFEAGFAMGLGLPVIFTCRSDHFIDGDRQKLLHFDVEHFNFILWENELQLREKLSNRIKATIPLAK